MGVCLVCGNSGTEEMAYSYQYRTDAFRNYFPDIKIMFCPKCKLLQTDIESKNDNEDKLSEYYKKEYRGGVRTA